MTHTMRYHSSAVKAVMRAACGQMLDHACCESLRSSSRLRAELLMSVAPCKNPMTAGCASRPGSHALPQSSRPTVAAATCHYAQGLEFGYEVLA